MTSEVASVAVAGKRIELEPHNCFACGSLNTHGLNLRLHVTGERCWTELSLPARFEGWDGIAHGGIVTTILDEVMAWALIESDSFGLTARLSVEFKRPVPIDHPIRAEGWVVSSRRRLMSTGSELRDAATGRVLAAAEGIYVAATEDRKEALRARYGFRLVPGEEPVVESPDTVDGAWRR